MCRRMLVQSVVAVEWNSAGKLCLPASFTTLCRVQCLITMANGRIRSSIST